jgi:hypothetical protein
MNPFFADYYLADYTDSEAGNTNASYTYSQFKADVRSALEPKFGKSAVIQSDKVLKLHANTYRVDADIVPAFAYRLYLKKQFNHETGSYVTPFVQPPGIKFISDTGKVFTNWPEQHAANGVEKNKRTGGRFKLIVRAIKRMKYYLIEKNITTAVPSYLIECLLYNVLDTVFTGDSFKSNVESALLACFSATKDDTNCAKWLEVNEIKYLFHASQPWTRQQAYDFVVSAWSHIQNT